MIRQKRGRPRLDRALSTAISNSPTKSNKHHVRSVRLPHSQVERKYREGLNSELERLRRAVPTLPQSDEGASMGHIKPSKAMVLSFAIDYIHEIERERDGLREEKTRLERSVWTKGGKVDK
ncbi:hypothetical protein T440DRAFT_35722 [Plenodomus tracheiphilus IPT5]|uniref:BHLH domain-containing protein n=1 Tax=Plenodomus tracheiphilus IPT5 TaxID=1408161 RepID=A0A6A7APD8_9PLEO|nr:hypothetical protein T440DRAFT_35722 [Plenodomus tracheiphilus IPT5]